MRAYHFIYSFFYFLKQAFRKKHYQIIFYAPHHFNRGKNMENLFFTKLLKICQTQGISYLHLEEPDLYSNQKRSRIAIPFDFIYYLVILLRKFMRSEISYIEKDKKIGSFIKKIFFRRITFDNYITISQSMLSLFRGIYNDAKQFDLQHGTIHSRKEGYLNDGLVSRNLKENDTHLLLSGMAYKELLIQNEKENYFRNHIEVIGTSMFSESNANTSNLNKNILVSLQFTHDHSESENQQIASILEKFIKREPFFQFYLRSHPRFNNEIDLDRFLSFSNVSLISGSLLDNFSKCALHLTTYSTTVFEAALQGIPTCFLYSDSPKMNIFDSQYNYPFYKASLTEFYNKYSAFSLQVKTWAERFYQPLNKDSFLKALKNV
tara:strand:- start:182 stop:1312 length:1131 start_codon:yes stop_codon:yes gene_type:complete